MPARAASDYGSELEYDAAVDAELRALEAAATASLWQRFRQRRGWGALSVSDLSGPAWCEAQHAYRLASKAHLPPLERPATITTASGASVAVDPARTAQREHVLEGGRSVHARIETEVMGDHDEVDVDVAGDEDWWALRVLNTAVCLEALLDKGRVRELPVVGWVGAFLVFGVCDEVERRELSPARARPAPPIPSASAASVDAHTRDRRHDAGEADCVAVRTSDAPPCRPSTPPRSGQRTLDAFFSPVPSPKRRAAAARAELVSPSLGVPSDCPDGAEVANDPQPSPRWGFVLSDTKTRFNCSIPSHAESRPARLQLMIYHRLLTSLLLPESSGPDTTNTASAGPPPFSWSRLYRELRLDPNAPLSAAFLASILPIIAGSGLGSILGSATTLGDFVAVLGALGPMLRGARPPDRLLEDEMEISYRLRTDGRTYKGRRRAVKRSRDKREGRAANEDQGKRPRARARGAPPSPTTAVATSGWRRGDEVDEGEDLRRAIELSLQEAQPPGAATRRPDATPPDEAAPAGAVSALVPTFHADAPAVGEADTADSQLPFLANPSLPVPLPPVLDDASSFPSSPDVFKLSLNSQAGSCDDGGGDARPAAAPSSRSSRYNLRPRQAANRSLSPALPSATTEETASAPPETTPAQSSSSTRLSQPAPSSSSPLSAASTAPSDADDTDPHFIGVEVFRNDPAELDAWLASVSAYWRSEREPVGVGLTEVKRCRTCEFEDGCEWRAKKAAEALERVRAKRLQREDPKPGGNAGRKDGP